MKVLVIGGTGMLGSALVSVLGRNAAIELYATLRVPWVGRPPGNVKRWIPFQAGEEFPLGLELGPGDWIVNAAGLIRHRMREDTPAQAAEAIRVNSLLPYELAEVCHKTGASMVHVTTDCVFSGTVTGRSALNRYEERHPHDARSLYGRTKSMGEVMGWKRVFNIRCSIVGPEPCGRNVSLMEWFLSQPGDSTVAGHSDHFWNGVTTLALSKVIEGLILYDDLDLPSLHHLVPKSFVSKADLLGLLKEHFNHRTQIQPRTTGGVDRTLGTFQRELNNRLWAVAGYDVPPTIEEMVAELARWVRSGGYPFKEVSQ